MLRNHLPRFPSALTTTAQIVISLSDVTVAKQAIQNVVTRSTLKKSYIIGHNGRDAITTKDTHPPRQQTPQSLHPHVLLHLPKEPYEIPCWQQYMFGQTSDRNYKLNNRIGCRFFDLILIQSLWRQNFMGQKVSCKAKAV